ncbi:MAG: alpha/beta hydrolase [Pseudomonadota bacterium]
MTNASNLEIMGKGEPLVLLHGWPFHKATYRKLMPLLAGRYCCHAINSLGMTDETLTAQHDLSFEGHARRVGDYIRAQNWDQVTLLAHDTAGTFARLLAATEPDLVGRLILLNTEIPHHRPPFIPLYRALSRLPLFRTSFALLMRSRTFQRSAMGFGGCFADRTFIDDEFIALFGSYWFASDTRFQGLIRYLQGIDFSVVDALHETHRHITAPVHFIWGAEDKTFPMTLGRQMADRMPSLAGFTPIPGTCFLPHEERPNAVAEAILAIS